MEIMRMTFILCHCGRDLTPGHGYPQACVDADCLIAAERGFMADLLARALKDEGKPDAKRIVADEIQAKYQGWTGLGRIGDAVEKVYADPGGPP
jgi:hypothetical protein